MGETRSRIIWECLHGWCRPWSSKPVGGVNNAPSRFDSDTLPFRLDTFHYFEIELFDVGYRLCCCMGVVLAPALDDDRVPCSYFDGADDSISFLIRFERLCHERIINLPENPYDSLTWDPWTRFDDICCGFTLYPLRSILGCRVRFYCQEHGMVYVGGGKIIAVVSTLGN
jgi:hypothetical protein